MQIAPRFCLYDTPDFACVKARVHYGCFSRSVVCYYVGEVVTVLLNLLEKHFSSV
jgi:hypothetical protein